MRELGFSQPTAVERLLSDLNEKVCDGAAGSPVLLADAAAPATTDEKDEVRRVLNQMGAEES